LEAEHVGTNFCISHGADNGLVILVGLNNDGDNDDVDDDVTLNGLLAITDVTPADPDRDLEASDTFDQSTGENPGGGVAERAGGSGR